MANLKEKGTSGLSVLYRRYKMKAKYRKLEFSLDKNTFKMLTSSNCYYCGEKPNQQVFEPNLSAQGKINSTYLYNGLDRIDNNKGYTKDNVVPCCRLHNEWKRALSYKDFINIIHNTSEFLKEQKRE